MARSAHCRRDRQGQEWRQPLAGTGPADPV